MISREQFTGILSVLGYLIVCLLNMTAGRRDATYVPSVKQRPKIQNAQKTNCAAVVTPVRMGKALSWRAALTDVVGEEDTSPYIQRLTVTMVSTLTVSQCRESTGSFLSPFGK